MAPTKSSAAAAYHPFERLAVGDNVVLVRAQDLEALAARAIIHVQHEGLHQPPQYLKKQPQCGFIPRLRIPGTIPGGYPDQLRGGFVTVVVVCIADAGPPRLNRHVNGFEKPSLKNTRWGTNGW